MKKLIRFIPIFFIFFILSFSSCDERYFQEDTKYEHARIKINFQNGITDTINVIIICDDQFGLKFYKNTMCLVDYCNAEIIASNVNSFSYIQ